MDAVTIRPMQPEDWPTALQLSTGVGWNQTRTDWERLWRLDPAGAFVAEHAGDVVGTTLCCRFGEIAWLAMVIVAPSHRAQGIGRRLVEAGLAFAESQAVRTIRLDATPLGEHVYRRLGFQPQFLLTRMTGVVERVIPAEEHSIPIHEATSIDDAMILDGDVRATHTNRGPFLRSLRAAGPTWVATSHCGTFQGFLAQRPGRTAWQLGPCCGSSEAARALLLHSLAKRRGECVAIDLPADRTDLIDFLKSHGLAPQRPLLRMCRGTPVLEDPQRFHVSSGPELG